MNILLELNRKIHVRDLESQAVVERLYICLELHLRITQGWMRFELVPTVFGAVTGVLAASYATIRYSQLLPAYLYIMFPLIAVVLISSIFWIFYDAVVVVRASEEIVLPTLRSYEAEPLKQLSRAEKVKALKRVRAMQVLRFPIGNFISFSLKVPVVIWDEVLSQLILLLSF